MADLRYPLAWPPHIPRTPLHRRRKHPQRVVEMLRTRMDDCEQAELNHRGCGMCTVATEWAKEAEALRFVIAALSPDTRTDGEPSDQALRMHWRMAQAASSEAAKHERASALTHAPERTDEEIRESCERLATFSGPIKAVLGSGYVRMYGSINMREGGCVDARDERTALLALEAALRVLAGER